MLDFEIPSAPRPFAGDELPSDKDLFGGYTRDGRRKRDRLPSPFVGDTPAPHAPRPLNAQPMHQPRPHDNEPFLHGLVGQGHLAGGGHGRPMSMFEQGAEALNKAVDQTNEAWAKEMDRRSDVAEADRERSHKLALARMEQDSLARHDAAMLQQDQERRAFLGNLLAGAGMIPHQVRFGG